MFEQKNGGDHSDDVDELSASDESEPEEQPSSAAFVPELDDDDDEEEEEEVEVCAPAVGHRALNAFSLRGGNSAFTNRSHSIFDCLDSVARLASSSRKQDDVTDGVFARPLPPRPSRKTSQPLSSCPIPAKKKGPPDYLVHPERWTHYSLEDVTETSDQGNSKAAHDFLSSLHQRKEQQENSSDSSCDSQQKIIFSRDKDSGHLKEQVADHLSPVEDKKTETHLTHLEEEEEEEQRVEKLKAGGKTVNQSVEEEDKDEEKDGQGAVGRPEESKQVEKEKSEEEAKMEEVNPSFTSFRKSKLKNYRKSSGREDN